MFWSNKASTKTTSASEDPRQHVNRHVTKVWTFGSVEHFEPIEKAWAGFEEASFILDRLKLVD